MVLFNIRYSLFALKLETFFNFLLFLNSISTCVKDDLIPTVTNAYAAYKPQMTVIYAQNNS